MSETTTSQSTGIALTDVAATKVAALLAQEVVTISISASLFNQVAAQVCAINSISMIATWMAMSFANSEASKSSPTR
jgi:hypothetical protein